MMSQKGKRKKKQRKYVRKFCLPIGKEFKKIMANLRWSQFGFGCFLVRVR